MKKEDIEFLKELKKEMIEGDHVSQAYPRFWMIMDYTSISSTDEEWDDPYLLDRKDCEVVTDGSDLDDVKERMIEALAKEAWGYADTDSLRLCNTVKEIVDWMIEWAYKELGDFEIRYSKEIRFLSEETGVFLTLKDCEKHLKDNWYHYSNKAHPYALTAWRNPNFERLMDIVTKTDWDKEEGE